jgi:hypothetical protein
MKSSWVIGVPLIGTATSASAQVQRARRPGLR